MLFEAVPHTNLSMGGLGFILLLTAGCIGYLIGVWHGADLGWRARAEE